MAAEVKLRQWVEEGAWPQVRIHLAQRPLNSLTPDEQLAGALLYAYGDGQRDLKKAIAWAEQAASVRPRHAETLTSLAHLYAQAGRLPMAFHVASQATDADPKSPKAWAALGLAAHHCQESDLGNRAIDCAWSFAGSLPESARVALLRSTRRFAPFWRYPLKGCSLSLERLSEVHANFLAHCRRDGNFRRQYHMFQSAEWPAIQADIERAMRPPLETQQIQWVIVREGLPIGLAALVDLDLQHLRAEPLIGFPGQPPGRHAVEASLLIQEFAFCTIGLNRLYSYVYGENPNAQDYIRHLGFSLEGVMREHVQDPETKDRQDLYLSSLLRGEFMTNARNQRLAQRLLGRSLVNGPLSADGEWSETANGL